jgi:hypothetical protein
MSFIIRIVSSKRRFDEPDPDENPWLGENEIPADAVTDLKTSKNELSIFKVENDSSDIERVVSAFASRRDSFANVDFVYFDSIIFEEIIRQHGLKTNNNLGATPDKEVNKWHCNIVELTDRKVIELAKAMIYQGEKGRKDKKKIKRLIEDACSQKKLAEKEMNQKLLTKLRSN